MPEIELVEVTGGNEKVVVLVGPPMPPPPGRLVPVEAEVKVLFAIDTVGLT